MANWISSVAGFRIDNAAGTLTDIKQYINSIRDTGGANRLDDTGLGDTRERRPGPRSTCCRAWTLATSRPAPWRRRSTWLAAPGRMAVVSW